jgi:hypothetical protein
VSRSAVSGGDALGAGEFQQQGQDAGLGDEEITADEASGATPQDPDAGSADET